MATIRPFKAFRPKAEFAREVAAKPYDVLSSDEAREEVKGHPLSFLHVGKPEVDLDPNINLHDRSVYERGKENLQKLISQKVPGRRCCTIFVCICANNGQEHTVWNSWLCIGG